MEYIFKVDPAKFDPTRFSVQTLAGRGNGSERCLFRVARVPVRSRPSASIHTR